MNTQSKNSTTEGIAIVVSNPAVSTTLGWPVGFWASELIHPYDAFRKQGYEVTIASPEGGEVKPDAMSDPRDESGYSAWDELSRSYLEDAEFQELLQNTIAVRDLNIDDFDALVVAGGQAPMFTFEDATDLHAFFASFYATGKPTAALCHGTAVLCYAKDNSGAYLVKGKTVTGFTNDEEDQADQQVGQKIMPWRIEDELTKLGAHFVQGEPWEDFAVEDGNLITGQQQMSGGKTAALVLDQLKTKEKFKTK